MFRRRREAGRAPRSGGAARPAVPDVGLQDSDNVDEPSRFDDVAVVDPHRREDEPATQAAGRAVYESVEGEAPDEETRQRLGQAAHWAMGLGMGALYGAARGGADGFDPVGGLGFGAGIWLVADEVAVPVLGLGSGPTAVPMRTHLEGLAAHLVYGATTAVTAHALRRVVA